VRPRRACVRRPGGEAKGSTRPWKRTVERGGKRHLWASFRALCSSHSLSFSTWDTIHRSCKSCPLRISSSLVKGSVTEPRARSSKPSWNWPWNPVANRGRVWPRFGDRHRRQLEPAPKCFAPCRCFYQGGFRQNCQFRILERPIGVQTEIVSIPRVRWKLRVFGVLLTDGVRTRI
jgi:hypothetical protein